MEGNGLSSNFGGKIELLKADEGGGPAGVKDPAEDGGGPAGVVEGFEAPNEYCLAPSFVLLSGVEGGLEDNGTWKPDIVRQLLLRR